MLAAPIPIDEAERIAALRRYDVLDTPPETDFDEITWLAARICGMPMAFVSLVDSEREFFKAAVGTDLRESPRDISFCGHTILQSEAFVIPDALHDPRFTDNPHVTSGTVGSYAGVPLITPEGYAIGALCVKDSRPRALPLESVQALAVLGREVIAQLELRRMLVASRADAATARRLAAIVESSSDAIVAVDLEGTVVSWNPAAERLYGYRAAEMIGTSYMAIVPADDHDGIWQLLCRAEAGQNVDVREGVRIRADGSTLEVSSAPSRVLDETGEVIGFSITDHDLTERRSVELAKRDFVASVSHELRTPLTSILGYVEILADEDGGLNEQQSLCLDIIARNAERLKALISDVLTLAAVQSQTAFRPSPADLGTLLAQAIQEQEPAAQERCQDVRLVVPERAVVATVDAKQIAQVAANLISNAIKYTPDRGEIIVDLSVDEAGVAAIRVIDSGIGVAPEDVGHLTERFFRAHSALDAAIPGTGLGLAICAGIAAAHQGSLSVQSELGVGSAFTISFPLEHPARQVED